MLAYAYIQGIVMGAMINALICHTPRKFYGPTRELRGLYIGMVLGIVFALRRYDDPFVVPLVFMALGLITPTFFSYVWRRRALLHNSLLNLLAKRHRLEFLSEDDDGNEYWRCTTCCEVITVTSTRVGEVWIPYNTLIGRVAHIVPAVPHYAFWDRKLAAIDFDQVVEEQFGPEL